MYKRRRDEKGRGVNKRRQIMGKIEEKCAWKRDE